MAKEELLASMTNSGALKTDAVIKAFEKVKREEFCLPEHKDVAYEDRPLQILAEQTISQPTTVAIMTESLELKKGDKVLEIGTGSGYQAAIISEVIGNRGKLYTIERIPELAKFAKKNLKREGYKNVKVVVGDGSLGLKSKAPFDRIIVTACSPKVPISLKEQLKIGGKLVIPIGPDFYCQDMIVLTKLKNGFKSKNMGSFCFVPLIGKEGWKR